MFSPVMLDHFQHPRNSGVMENADAQAEVENPVCGDRLHAWLRVRDGVIDEMRWQARGCAPAIAAASMLSEIVAGLPVGEARKLTAQAVAEALGGLPPRKGHAAALAVSALQRALSP